MKFWLIFYIVAGVVIATGLVTLLLGEELNRFQQIANTFMAVLFCFHLAREEIA